MPALATTDHGYVFGAYEFWKKAQGTGVKPIIGVEAYITPRHASHGPHEGQLGRWRRDDISGGGAYTHMTMLAESTEGMHNLFRMSSIASLDQVYTKWPASTRSCSRRLRQGPDRHDRLPLERDPDQAALRDVRRGPRGGRGAARHLRAENVFVELMDHGLEIERRVQKDLIRLARDLGLPLVATNDLHYTRAEDAKAHAALLCVQSGSWTPTGSSSTPTTSTSSRPRRCATSGASCPRPATTPCSSPSGATCRSPRARSRYMPHFPCPRARTRRRGSSRRSRPGSQRRFPTACRTTPASRRPSRRTSSSRRAMSCFLVVADFINWAKRNGIRVGPGRGSGAGSMCAYAMGITDLDPIPHGLIFERFLNPERMSMPDFDVDFDERRRGEVIGYVTEKYGEERVAQIVTYGTIKAKQAVKDAARVMGHPFSVGEQLTKAMPPDVMGKGVPRRHLAPDQPLPRRRGVPRWCRRTAPRGGRRHGQGPRGTEAAVGVHAAGVIMSSEPLIDVIPIMKRLQDGQVITQFDYPSCEALGLVKMDFLGLRNLDPRRRHRQHQGQPRRGHRPRHAVEGHRRQGDLRPARPRDTLGVFQLDGGGMRALLRLMQPDNFEDSAALASTGRARWA